jgi:hypothetical protein
MRKVLRSNVAAVVFVVLAAFAGSAFGMCPTSFKNATDGGTTYCTLNADASKGGTCTYSCYYKGNF